MDLKSILKKIKLNESNISMAFGGIVIVVVGMLVVNYFKSKDSVDKIPPMDNLVAGEQNIHTVEAGEGLWQIAEKEYGDGYSWNKIAQANGLEAPYEIEIGQELVIPELMGDNPEMKLDEPVAVKETEPVVTKEETNEPAIEEKSPVVKGESYIVKHGDNLWKIAEEVYGDGYRWVDIARANELVNPNVIHTGNVFVLPE